MVEEPGLGPDVCRTVEGLGGRSTRPVVACQQRLDSAPGKDGLVLQNLGGELGGRAGRVRGSAGADRFDEVQYLDARSHLLPPQITQHAQVRLAVPAVAGHYLVQQTEHLRLAAALQP